jgi:hypothetical protein
VSRGSLPEDRLASTIDGGTSEIQRNIIAKTLATKALGSGTFVSGGRVER